MATMGAGASQAGLLLHLLRKFFNHLDGHVFDIDHLSTQPPANADTNNSDNRQDQGTTLPGASENRAQRLTEKR